MADNDKPDDDTKPKAAGQPAQARKAPTLVAADAVDKGREVVEDVSERVNGFDMQAVVSDLSSQLSDIRSRLDEMIAAPLHTAGELVHAAQHEGSVAARRAGRQIARTARAVRDDPVPVVVAFGVLALLAGAVVGERSVHHRR